MWYNDFMTVEAFIKKYNFIPKIDNVYERILYDMNLGLFEDKSKAGQDMFNTWILPPKNKPKNKKIIVIDAGGTNFRSCLITFDEKGDVTISDFRKTSMPGIEKELSKIGVASKFSSIKWDYWQTLISRGDANLTEFLIQVYKKGGNIGAYKSTLKELNLNIDKFINGFELTDSLPWDFIENNPRKELLINEFNRLNKKMSSEGHLFLNQKRICNLQ